MEDGLVYVPKALWKYCGLSKNGFNNIRSDPANYADFNMWFQIWKTDKVAADPKWKHPKDAVDSEIFVHFCQKKSSSALEYVKVKQVLDAIKSRRADIAADIAATQAAQDQLDQQRARAAKAAAQEDQADQDDLVRAAKA